MPTQLESAYADLSVFIGGEWLSSDGRDSSPVINPATEEVIGRVPHASTTDLDQALTAAAEGFKTWRALFPEERGKIMKRAAGLLRERMEAIARIATTESGKVLVETRNEVGMAANVLEWYAEEGRRAYGRVLPQRAPGTRLIVVKEPVGPVAAFAPWNFPVGNPARKIGAALGAGCSVILKPAEETPASGLAVAHCLVDAGLPPNVLAIVYGIPSDISSYLLASPIIRKVSFTGSISVGKALMKLAAERMQRTTMELGGHAPVLVFDDVDVERVLDLSVAAKFRNAGQVCVSPTRFYVHERIYEKFVEGFAARAKSLSVGDGLDEKNRMGPLIHSRRLAAIDAMVQDARSAGAKIQAGGSRLRRPGYFYSPTVISDVPQTARIMSEEPFGPVAAINPFSDCEAVIREANNLPFGLAAFAFTSSARIVKLLGEQLEAGMVGLNTFAISVPESPFGGVKESGHGSEEGIEGLEACLVTKFISEA
jgi:succinate-semialdehyde dehydrogenase / glutarate-semialdehyde dehydrogenase